MGTAHEPPRKQFMQFELSERLHIPGLLGEPIRAAIGFLERIQKCCKRTLARFELYACSELDKHITSRIEGGAQFPQLPKGDGFLAQNL